jgi:GNAT superfamily N-acetyltransferase
MLICDIIYTYRKANSADCGIFFDSYTSYDDVHFDKMKFTKTFESLLLDKQYLIFVFEAASNNTIAGGIILKLSNELFNDKFYIEIHHLYILLKYRKLNAAPKLYSFVEEIAKEYNATKIKVACNLNSTLNQRFYTRNKFIFSKKLFEKYIF